MFFYQKRLEKIKIQPADSINFNGIWMEQYRNFILFVCSIKKSVCPERKKTV
jgi:hypothetical protein